jgi:hypothetical protein
LPIKMSEITLTVCASESLNGWDFPLERGNTKRNERSKVERSRGVFFSNAFGQISTF